MDEKVSPLRAKSRKRVSEPYVVFISHSTKDRWIARQMSSILESRGGRYGLSVFLDEKDIEGGMSISSTIRQNIDRCDEFVVLLTSNSVIRPWVLIELGAAWQIRKRIVAIIDKVTPEEMPDIIADKKAIDLNDFDVYVQQVIRRTKERRLG